MGQEFVKILETKDVGKGEMRAVNFGNEVLCVINLGGKFYVINNVCTHEGGPLNEGTLDGFEVECPWHGAIFDIRTGEVKAPPAEQPVSTYEVKIQEDEILIRKIFRN
ncbi:MAG: non-heme iron oxygenase ferredoxin subunit [Nitrosotalea sp.]